MSKSCDKHWTMNMHVKNTECLQWCQEITIWNQNKCNPCDDFEKKHEWSSILSAIMNIWGVEKFMCKKKEYFSILAFIDCVFLDTKIYITIISGYLYKLHSSDYSASGFR